jgi:hypothetical protein
MEKLVAFVRLVGFPAEGYQQNVHVRASQCVSACPAEFTIVTSAAHLTGVANQKPSIIMND